MTVSVAYLFFTLLAARAFFRRGRSRRVHFTAPVTLLKPVRGVDAESRENLESFCRLDYLHYQIIFGVSDPNDPVIPIIRSLIAAYPKREISLVVATQSLGSNGKVSTLCEMLPEAKHPFLVISDGDIRVAPDYLRRVMAPFANPRVGLVTTLYRGTGARNVGSALEAMTVNTDFLLSVLAAERLEGLSFALGATAAFRRKALETIQGLEPLADFLADDYQLGNRIFRADWDVVLSDTVVDHVISTATVGEYFAHQLRWARTYRVCRPKGYFFSILTQGMFFTAGLVLFNPSSPLAYQLFIGYIVLRLGAASWIQSKFLGEKDQKYLWLLPIRDLFAVGIWAAAFLGNEVTWRGKNYRIGRDGRVAERGGHGRKA